MSRSPTWPLQPLSFSSYTSGWDGWDKPTGLHQPIPVGRVWLVRNLLTVGRLLIGMPGGAYQSVSVSKVGMHGELAGCTGRSVQSLGARYSVT